MGPELRELARAPIGLGDLAHATNAASGENPVCGDSLRFEARVAPGESGAVLEALAFRATACPACVAVASCAVKVLRGSAFPVAMPPRTLHAELERCGGLTRFEEHALALVEDVLRRL